jgi:hypothetical protein
MEIPVVKYRTILKNTDSGPVEFGRKINSQRKWN